MLVEKFATTSSKKTYTTLFKQIRAPFVKNNGGESVQVLFQGLCNYKLFLQNIAILKQKNIEGKPRHSSEEIKCSKMLYLCRKSFCCYNNNSIDTKLSIKKSLKEF